MNKYLKNAELSEQLTKNINIKNKIRNKQYMIIITTNFMIMLCSLYLHFFTDLLNGLPKVEISSHTWRFLVSKFPNSSFL